MKYVDKVMKEFNKAKSANKLDADEVFNTHLGVAAYVVATSMTPPYGFQDPVKAREMAHKRLDHAIDDYLAGLGKHAGRVQ